MSSVYFVTSIPGSTKRANKIARSEFFPLELLLRPGDRQADQEKMGEEAVDQD